MLDLEEELKATGYGQSWMAPVEWSRLDRGIFSIAEKTYVPAIKAAENKKHYADNAERIKARRRERHAALSRDERRAVNRASKLRARIRMATLRDTRKT